MDGPDRERNTALAVEYCLAHPRWRLSLQMHKLLGIPCSLLGQELELGPEPSEDDKKALAGLNERVQALEQRQSLMLFIIERLDRGGRE
jgi:hypothetical protein